MTLALVAALAVIAAGCQRTPAGGAPEAPGSQPAGFSLLATATPFPVDTATATATPLPTATPTATPTPPAASAAGSAPVGRVIFATTRAGQPGQQLWLMEGSGVLTSLAGGVPLDDWQCSRQPPVTCALATTDGYLLAADLDSPAAALLDQLGSTETISPTVTISSTGTISPTEAISSTGESEAPLLALAPGGASLAVALADGVRIYGLDAPALAASIAVTGVTELAWSPDGQRLALVYPVGSADALALWSAGDDGARILTQMDRVQHAVWSPDGEKIAFDAYQPPSTPPSQGDRSDVFVAFLKGGEIPNFSEVYLRNAGVAAAERVAAWSPRWRSADVLSYLRGVPDAPDSQSVMSHPVRSRTASRLWPAAEEGALGIVATSDGAYEARAVRVDERVVVQVRPAEDEQWRDLPGAYDAVTGLAWAPDAAEPRRLLVAQPRTLLTVDVASGAIQGLALACPECTITRAVWTP